MVEADTCENSNEISGTKSQ